MVYKPCKVTQSLDQFVEYLNSLNLDLVIACKDDEGFSAIIYNITVPDSKDFSTLMQRADKNYNVMLKIEDILNDDITHGFFSN